MSAVLVVDDAAGFASVQRVLQPAGFDLCHTRGLDRARALSDTGSFDLGLIDFRLGTSDERHTGLDLLRQISPQFPAIVLSDAAHANQACESVRLGARDYLLKPVTEERLLPVVHAMLAPPPPPHPLDQLVGSSPPMRTLREQIELVARRDARVLIVGPSGSGKELVARALHHLSRRRGAPFVPVNCAALPRDLVESELFGYERGAFTGAAARRRGLFELAHGGTILLDEIEELPPEAQAKLLRVLEDLRFRRVGGEEELDVDVRVVAATNQNLVARVTSGLFRDDLFHRLNVVTLTVPALAERLGDLPELVEHLLAQFGARGARLSRAVQCELRSHSWPGNVRELRNTIERALVFTLGSEITSLGLLPATTPHEADPTISTAIDGLRTAFAGAVRAGDSLPHHLVRTIEHALAHTALGVTGGNKSAAARCLDLDRKALERRLQESWRDPRCR
jgi:two-component system response regulator HydG